MDPLEIFRQEQARLITELAIQRALLYEVRYESAAYYATRSYISELEDDLQNLYDQIKEALDGQYAVGAG